MVSGNLISEDYKVGFFPGDRMPRRVTEVSDQFPWPKKKKESRVCYYNLVVVHHTTKGSIPRVVVVNRRIWER